MRDRALSARYPEEVRAQLQLDRYPLGQELHWASNFKIPNYVSF